MPCQNTQEHLVEAANYALIRRLTPMLRHNMAGVLQPLCMMSMLLEKRLQNPNLDFVALADKSSQLKTLAREATNVCMDLMTWLVPNSSERVRLAVGIEDALELVKAELSFKGFTLLNKIGDLDIELPRSLTRTVFMAALLALTDVATTPANVVLEAQFVDDELMLTITLQPEPDELLPDALASYRNLDWLDVQALAEVERVRLVHSADSVELYYSDSK